jgi:hypothetical protein
MAENARSHVVSYRVTAMEAAHMQAAGAALTTPRRLNDFARAAALSAARQKVPPPAHPIRHPARRKPTVDMEALARVLASLGKLGSNVNQLARCANQRGTLPTEAVLRGIADEVAVTRNLVTAALAGESPDGH